MAGSNSDDDGRAQPFQLTTAGKKLLRKAVVVWTAAQEPAKKLLGEEIVEQLDLAVKRINEATVREWCRLGCITAEKEANGRKHEWRVSQDRGAAYLESRPATTLTSKLNGVPGYPNVFLAR